LNQLHTFAQPPTSVLDSVRRFFPSHSELDPQPSIFQSFLQRCVDARPEEIHDIPRYQAPSGQLNAEILHCLHWPPEEGQPPYNNTFNVKNPSIRLVSKIFPNIQDTSIVCDLLTKREAPHHVKNGQRVRRTPDEIYRENELFIHHQWLLTKVLAMSVAGIVVVWGMWARKFIEQLVSESPELFLLPDGSQVSSLALFPLILLTQYRERFST